MSVEKGQIEAGLSLGYTENRLFAISYYRKPASIAIPALANSFIDIIKGSAMAFTVGVIEITAAARLYAASTFRFFEGYCGLIFYVLAARRHTGKGSAADRKAAESKL